MQLRMMVALVCVFAAAHVDAAQSYKQGPRDQITRIARGNVDAAERYWEDYLRDHPDDLEAHYGLAICYASRGRVADALAMAEKGVAKGLPFGRFLAGPREMLRPLTESPRFEAWATAQGLELIHGPMLGGPTDRSVRVWVRTWHEVPVEVRASRHKDMSQPLIGQAETSADRDFTAVVDVQGLEPSTTYYYQLTVAGKRLPEVHHFVTMPPAGAPAQLTVFFGGGAGYTPTHERMWDVISGHEPSAYLALGDNVYIDTPEVQATQQYCYYRRQSRPEYRRLVASTPVFAIWDDHDFVVNDGEGGPDIDRPSWKRAVWRTFRNNFVNPAYGGGEQQPGCWFTCSIADIDFFFLDGRYYRSRKNSTMLGPVQKAWLFETLRESKGTFKVLCCNVPMTPGVKPGSKDPWDGFPDEREEIFRFVEQQKIEGLLMIAADRHRSDAWKISREQGYPFYEFQSSKLTNVHTHKVLDGCLFGYNKKCSFGLLTFDTTAADPYVTYQAVNIDNEPVGSVTVRRSELSFRGDDSDPTHAQPVGGVLPAADQLPIVAPLPPEPLWHGRSEQLIASKDDRWVTPGELSGLTDSPSYAETIDWLTKLADASPQVSMQAIGTSPEGRTIWLVVASKEGGHSAADLRATGRPTLLAQAGIHSGEIDGKDAGMMLLRDMTVGGSKCELLDKANFVFVPILSVDGHERRSPWGRINQRGPQRQGWRTTARNLNLNRDYTKLDTPEMRAVVAVLEDWPIDLYLDLHVTDGADYQYDITFGWNGPHAYSPAIATWLDWTLRPALDRDLEAMGHVPGPLIFQVDQSDPSQGLREWTASPRYSNGYGDLRHLPTILVENHSLKSFRRRVLGTYVLLESCLRVLGDHPRTLRQAVASDQRLRRDPLPLAWKVASGPPPQRRYKTIRAELFDSEISGDRCVRWTGEPVTLDVPLLRTTQVAARVTRPPAYWVPVTWPEIIDRLRQHGIQMETSAASCDMEVAAYRLDEAKMAATPFEGHVRVQPTSPQTERRRMTFPAGSVRVPTDQPLGDLAVVLLEPTSSDSFFQWGFFPEILTRTEYAEPYALEPLARKMLAANPALDRQFKDRLAADSDFFSSPRQRLDFFYRRTPYYDDRYRLYPIARELPGS